MSLWLPKIRPRRMMRGADLTSIGITNFKTTNLYNNSTGAEMLCVWAIKPNHPAGPLPVVVRSGLQGAVSETVNTLVSGGARLAGQISVADEAAILTPDYFVADINQTDTSTPSGVPYALLQPGWSLSVGAIQTGKTGAQCGFIWQAVHPQDLDGHHCQICDGDLAIGVRAQG
jgi:hypothetical protein